MTRELYYEDQYMKEFDAVVLDCIQDVNGYIVVLDSTAFFPNEGGQYADTGTINGTAVENVKKQGDTIYHYLNYPIEVGTKVHGILDFDKRYERMQGHTGEHIVSGVIHNLYGYENVGFHLSDDELTMDTSGELTDEQLEEIELLANKIIYQNLPITCIYPKPEELSNYTYRSKLELTENVRLVKIGDVDICACCAPHVKSTGEVGMIKIVKSMRWKGGMRLNLECGIRALRDYNKRQNQVKEISVITNTKADEITEKIKEIQNKFNEVKKELKIATAQLVKNQIDTKLNDKIIVVFTDNNDIEVLREAVNYGISKTDNRVIALGGNDEIGYSFVLGICEGEILPFAKEMQEKLSGRGGGKGNMVTGSLKSKKQDIVDYFNALR